MRRFIPSTSCLIAFDTAARHLSFTKAAHELHMTQGAVSRQLAVLETYLGVKLFERVNHRLILTEAGREYAMQISATLTQVEIATFQVMTYKNSAGMFNLATLPTFGIKWLIPRLPKFTKAYPEVIPNLSTEVLPFDFNSRQVDAAIHFGEPDWPGAVMVRLIGEEVVPVCSPSLSTEVRSVDDLTRMTLLQHTTRPLAWQDWFRQAGVDCPNALSGPRFEQLLMVIQAAVAGLGIALMPKFLVEVEIASGQLYIPFPLAFKSPQSYYLTYPEKNASKPAVIKFRDWILSELQDS
ncbi:transcriptional regulator GcvA [Glaciimonas sp. PCH181]|uniref:transcriptional regulator GcvA n=1 Tax=Glaciimonas sp. PCH181 TaxID=2133943 RepID=UPI000D3BC0B6|nr:transcriptional regulator GcvA [Glaciimonas sp. PCH181]PUA17127.1 LysR family transcriptional regulator [Glaciimonas sp. PCH181]